MYEVLIFPFISIRVMMIATVTLAVAAHISRTFVAEGGACIPSQQEKKCDRGCITRIIYYDTATREGSRRTRHN